MFRVVAPLQSRLCCMRWSFARPRFVRGRRLQNQRMRLLANFRAREHGMLSSNLLVMAFLIPWGARRMGWSARALFPS